MLTLLSSVILVSSVQTVEDFHYRASSGEIQSSERLALEIDEENTLEFTDDQLLLDFLPWDAERFDEDYAPRDPSDLEIGVDIGIGIFTGMMALTSHDYYSLPQDIELVRLEGVLMFLFPFEETRLYRLCRGERYLIAVSPEPTERQEETLMSRDQIEEVCGSGVEETQV